MSPVWVCLGVCVGVWLYLSVGRCGFKWLCVSGIGRCWVGERLCLYVCVPYCWWVVWVRRVCPSVEVGGGCACVLNILAAHLLKNGGLSGENVYNDGTEVIHYHML